MLGKLIKHEFRALRRPLLPLFISIPGTALLAAISLFADMEFTKTVDGNEMNIIFIMMTTVLTIICSVALVAAVVVAFILIANRFYNSVIKSEAYLTFTLPVTPNQILMSKLITAYIYSLIAYALIGFGLFLIVTLGVVMPFGEYFDSSIFYQLRYLFAGNAAQSILLAVTSILNMLISPAYTILQLYFCLMAGAKIASKHKVLCAVGLYFAASIVISCLTSGLSTALSILSDGFSLSFLNISSAITLVLTLMLSALFYFLTHYFMSKNYNVE